MLLEVPNNKSTGFLREKMFVAGFPREIRRHKLNFFGPQVSKLNGPLPAPELVDFEP